MGSWDYVFSILPTYMVKTKENKKGLASNAQTLINNPYTFSSIIINADLSLIFVGPRARL